MTQSSKNATPSLTPVQQQLAKEWLFMCGKMRDLAHTGGTGVANILMKWVVEQHAYTPDIWCAPNEKGEHVLLEWISDTHSPTATEVTAVLDVWEKETDAPMLLNQPSHTGTVLLHVLWGHVMRHRTHDNKLLGCVLRVMRQTDPHHWTWLDRPGQHPGDGWVEQIVQRSQHNNDHKYILQALVQAYPRAHENAAPTHSPWIEVGTTQQANALLEAQHTLVDKVQVANLLLPAWEWLALSLGKGSSSPQAETFLSARSATFSIAEQEQMERFFVRQESWGKLVPQDRRSSTGYVKKILAHTDSDNFGRSALDCLLMHRADLFPVIAQQIMRLPAEQQQHWLAPDRAKYTILLRALMYGGRTLHNEMVKLLTACKIPPLLGVEDKGLFWHEQNSLPWLKLYESYRKGRIDLSIATDIANHQPEHVFGPLAQQKQWSAQWEKWLPQSPNVFSTLNKNSSSFSTSPSEIPTNVLNEYALMVRQMIVFATMGEKREQLCPELYSQLKMAVFLTFESNRAPSQNVASWNSNTFNITLTPTPPQVFTPAMQEIMRKTPEILLFRALGHQTIETREQWTAQWVAACDKHDLQQNVSSEIHEKNASSARRKI